jgi:hypothetical protein
MELGEDQFVEMLPMLLFGSKTVVILSTSKTKHRIYKIILPFVLCVCEMVSLTLREEHITGI